MEKALIHNNNANKLIVPKKGKAVILLLEFISKFESCFIHSINEIRHRNPDLNHFEITLSVNNLNQDVMEYINNNL